LRALSDDPEAHEHPSSRPHHRAQPGGIHFTGRYVLDAADECGNGRHQPYRQFVLGAQELVRRNMAALGIVVLFVTALAPLVRLIGALYVLIRAHEAVPPRHLHQVFALADRLRPWSMIDVFVFGVFVAYVKLGDVVTIGLAAGVYALLALTFVLVWTPPSTGRRCGKGSAIRAGGMARVAAPPA
jgi:hypothetical protein